MADCPRTSRKMPAWKAVQRGVRPGTIERLDHKRYVVEDRGDVPCLLSDGVRRRGQRTRCFAEESSSRKTCRSLADDDDSRGSSSSYPRVATGMHLSGVGELLDVPLTCEYRHFVENTSYRMQGTLADPYRVTVLGPFRSLQSGRLRIMCVATANFQGTGNDVANMAASFPETKSVVQGKRTTTHVVKYAPTLDMLRAWLRRLSRARDAGQLSADEHDVPAHCAPLVNELARRFGVLRELRRRCEEDAALRKRARAVARNLFFVGMYSRRWQGPGTPYPVRWTGLVGTSARPVSSVLSGTHVVASRSTHLPRLTTSPDALPADDLFEGRLYVMESQHLESAKEVLAQDAFLRRHMLACLESVHVVDGTHWPDETTADDLVGLVCTGLANDSRSCMRRNSAHMIQSSLMLLSYLYKSRPTWSRFEGALQLLDVHEG